ncbi:class I SAM-dependent methyltransferase [Streptomyces mirabilis]|nr:class I SAM-dependent methyltransferase [Streptomyces mirabilis]
MRRWRDATVDRVRELDPRRVLEIGVGSGLILAPLAPHCDAYWGTDISEVVIDRVRGQLADRPELDGRVELRAQAAHIFDGLPTGFFDTIILNSVVQYFPSSGYLTDVLTRALDLVVPGGAVFVGDVRNLRLHRALRTAVELRSADAADGDAAELRKAVDLAVSRETELLVDPDYFATVAPSFDLRIKPGTDRNELTGHRYDVVLRAEPTPHRLSAGKPWGRDVTDVDALRALLATRPAGLRVTGIPNRRVAGEIAAVRALEAGDLAAALAVLTGPEPELPDPQLLAGLGAESGYRTDLTWSGADHRGGGLEAVFSAPGTTTGGAYRPGPSPTPTPVRTPTPRPPR